MLKGIQVFLLTILFFISFSIKAHSGNSAQDCDSVTVYLEAYDKYYDANLDSALHNINRAISISATCQNTEKEVSYILEKARFLCAKGQELQARESNSYALERANEIGDSLLISMAYKNFGIILTDFAAYDSAIFMYNAALNFISPNKDTLELGQIYTRRGICYDSQGIYEKAIVDYLKALKIYETINDQHEISGVYNNLAIIYKRQDDVSSAILYYKKALDLAQQFGDQEGIAVSNVNIGLLEKNLGHFHKADSLFQAALSYFESVDFSYAIALVLHNLGELKRKEGIKTTALAYYLGSQKYATNYGYKQIDAKNNLSLAELNLENGKTDKALYHALHGLELAEKQNMLEEARSANKILSEIYETMGQSAKALAYYKSYHILEDSIYNDSKSTIINQLKAKFESDQKDVEIDLLKKEQILKETELEASARQKRFFVLLSFALFVIFAQLVYLYIRSQKYNERLKWKREEISKQKNDIEAKQNELIAKNEALVKLSQEKDDLINIVAHDLRSPLNQVKGLMSIMKMEIPPKEDSPVELYFEKIDLAIDTLRQRINKILDVELINSENISIKLEEVPAVKIIENIHSIFEGQAAMKGIKISNKCNGYTGLMKADYNYTIQVMENLVSNAIKFSKSGEDITLGISETSEFVRLHVKDQGPGITKEDQEKLFKKFTRLSAKPTGNEKSIGLGLAIVKKYVESMNGKVWCESKKGAGSEFIVQFGRV